MSLQAVCAARPMVVDAESPADAAAYTAAISAAAASGPSGIVTIAGGANATCPSKRVPVQLTAAPNSSAAEACVRVWSGNPNSWCFVGVRICPVPLVNGTATLFFKPCWQTIMYAEAVFRSASGATGQPVATATVIDCWPPKMSGMRLKSAPSAPPTSSAINLMWTGSPQSYGAGLAGYKLSYKAATKGGSPPAGCVVGNPNTKVAVVDVPAGVGTDASPMNVSGLAAATLYRFRLCAVDFAGNVAVGITAKVSTAA